MQKKAKLNEKDESKIRVAFRITPADFNMINLLIAKSKKTSIKLTMSKVLREALTDYLAKKRNKAI
jgi:hypothetical protein